MTTTGFISIVNQQDLEIVRTITDIPTGQTITKAWLTVKDDREDADPGIFQLDITATATTKGQITDDGTTDLLGEVVFTPTPAQINGLTVKQRYWYDIKVKLANGKTSVAEIGMFIVQQAVTQANT